MYSAGIHNEAFWGGCCYHNSFNRFCSIAWRLSHCLYAPRKLNLVYTEREERKLQPFSTDYDNDDHHVADDDVTDASLYCFMFLNTLWSTRVV